MPCGGLDGRNRDRLNLQRSTSSGCERQVVRTVSCGEHHVGAVSEVGVLYTWGRGMIWRGGWVDGQWLEGIKSDV